MVNFTGKNTCFKATWDADKQEYIVYYKGKFVMRAFSFKEIKSYLN